MQIQDVAGFEWDDGNEAKCQKHDVALSDLESAFYRTLHIFPDPAHSQSEKRYIALGKTNGGRNIFVCFTLRQREGKTYIRPISARYMHRKEIEHYEKEIANSDNR
ncbi:conserved hypothetical protein [Candidatus Methylobacter favarea]|uniref:BrnT family toxin n=1 Tax=Candidatus Methylobacter favarea TaxID=2707345 RepID=A0A8S0XUT7_9GAMM|nr:BrnT family toxin [Candidatus Methylobacter favarea]CAA9892438.1 conserved hypothetical protein [Candidatus Methylobacter favarea]